jgi:hypothetical protein
LTSLSCTKKTGSTRAAKPLRDAVVAHTFGVKLPAKLLKNCIVYQNPRVAIHQGGPVLANLDE